MQSEKQLRSISQKTAGYVCCTDGTDADATTEPAKYASYASRATGATNQASEGILSKQEEGMNFLS